MEALACDHSQLTPCRTKQADDAAWPEAAQQARQQIFKQVPLTSGGRAPIYADAIVTTICFPTQVRPTGRWRFVVRSIHISFLVCVPCMFLPPATRYPEPPIRKVAHACVVARAGDASSFKQICARQESNPGHKNGRRARYRFTSLRAPLQARGFVFLLAICARHELPGSCCAVFEISSCDLM